MPHHFSVYSDIHDDSAASAQDVIMEHMERRAKLPRSHFICLGDLGDWIFPSDTKRYMPSVTRKELLGVDDFIDQNIDHLYKKYSKFPFRLMCTGNHSHELLKRHYTNPMARLCRKLDLPFGGYSGYVRFRGPKCGFTMLYHHGAWGGRVVKGFAGARDYARHFEDWDVFCFGHNHQLMIDHESRMRLSAQGNLTSKDVYIVNTGTFLQGCATDQITYAEVKGYSPVALSAPLITVTPLPTGNSNSIPFKIMVSAGDC
jgi:hypothetical protein